MGLLAKRATKQAVAPQTTQVGDWLAQLTADYRFLTRADLLGLAGMRALLSVETGGTMSSWVTEGRHSNVELSGNAAHAMMRCETGTPHGTTLTCGATNPATHGFVEAWTLGATVADGGQVTVSVPQYRTREDEIRSGHLMVAARDAVVGTLESGIHLHLGDGPPDVDALVDLAPANREGFPRDERSPFSKDYLDKLTDRHRRPLPVPVAARAVIQEALASGPCRSISAVSPAIHVASLAGGRSFASGTVTLREAGETDELVIELPPTLAPVERQRSYRAALRLLRHLSEAMRESQPDVAAAISDHVDRIGADTQREDRHSDVTSPEARWALRWSQEIPAPDVPIAAGRWYPVAIHVASSTPVEAFVRAAAAANWVHMTKRTYSRGIRQAARDKNRTFSSRGCATLIDANNKMLPYLRYVHGPDRTDDWLLRAAGDLSWFWEVSAANMAPEDPGGLHEGLLRVSGWSHADGVLGYGENLLSLLRAFVEVVRNADADAKFTTLYLAT